MARRRACVDSGRCQRADRRFVCHSQAHGHQRADYRTDGRGIRHVDPRAGHLCAGRHARQRASGRGQCRWQQYPEHTPDNRRHRAGQADNGRPQRAVKRDSDGDTLVGGDADSRQQRMARWQRRQRGVEGERHLPVDILPALHALYFRKRQESRSGGCSGR